MGLPAKGFKSSCTAGRFLEFSGKEVERSDFRLLKNRENLQVGNVKSMIFPLQRLVDFIGQNYGLGSGDLIYTGTPEGIGKLQQGDRIELLWDGKSVGTCEIQIKPG
ncbi:fumarylacetoacetate hydrolase family protein [Ferviditalea candida]|uniref:Fumarylacetoacetate hydrolase family protein n=1 Tax=Ferviditalea candida TaxID=3108399 RepID=A0ABU5ZHV4_9BACL|nr:fumarylacetoacetate hydrolase family protein [Paenibacillaceae bacterium T2]